MERSVCIDWLSYTDNTSPVGMWYKAPPWENLMETSQATPRFGYNRAVHFASGLIIMYDGSTQTMGRHYIYSGQALANLNEVFNDGGMHILTWHEEQGHRCTRIDLAIDVKGDASFLPQIRVKVERSAFVGTARRATVVSSSDGDGLTLYMGSRSSERFVRIYDKAAQLAIEGDWTRIEAEIKHDSARTVARAILGFGAGGLGVVAQSVIKRVCNFDCKAWQAIFDGKVIPIGTPKIEEKQTEAWILGQVAKAVAKFEAQNPERHIVDRLFRAIDEMLGE